MSFRPSFKLSLPVVALALLVALAAWPGVRPRAAEATVGSLDANTTIGENGDLITITVTGDPDAGAMNLTATSNEVFNLVSCETDNSTDCDGAVTDPTDADPLTLDTTDVLVDDDYELVVTMLLSCTGAEVITVTANDTDAGSETLQILCAEDDDDPEVIIDKEADDDSSTFDFDWDADGTCAVVTDDDVDVGSSGSFDLADDEQASFFCDDDVDQLIVDEDDDGDLTSIDCDNGGDGVDDISGSTIDFDLTELSSSETVSCTYFNEGAAATATAVIGPVTSVVVAASNISGCGGTTAVQVTVRNASGGPAPAGTSLTASSSAGGTFQPAATLTGNFPFSFATFLYQAPPTFNGIATITVRTNNNVSGSVNIQVTCAAAPAPTPTAAPLRPPSAGSGGLIGGGGDSGGGGFGPYLPSTFAVSVAALVLGGTLMSRRREVAVAPVSSVSTPSAAPRTTGSGSTGFAILASLGLAGLALWLKRSRR